MSLFLNKRTLFSAAAVLLLSGRIFAAPIDGFLDTITSIGETEIKEPEEEENANNPPPPRSGAPNRSQNSQTCGCITSGCSHLFSLWLLHCFSIHFGSFPYAETYDANNGAYIQWNPEMKMQSGEKFFRFSTSVGGVYMDRIGTGFDVSFKGYLFKFFGPYIETWGVYDFSSSSKETGSDVSSMFSQTGKTMLGGARYGVHVSLIQTNSFSASLYWQYLQWYGAAQVNGGTLGIEFESFPLKPFVLHARFGGQTLAKGSSEFSESWLSDVNLTETEFQLGVMINRWEIFAGTRFWSHWNEEKQTNDFEWGGFTAGTRCYF